MIPFTFPIAWNHRRTARLSSMFEPPAVEALFQSARGLPRLVDRIAHYALTAAAVNDARTVTAEHLEHAVGELRL